jgi:hypothetical protein
MERGRVTVSEQALPWKITQKRNRVIILFFDISFIFTIPV